MIMAASFQKARSSVWLLSLATGLSQFNDYFLFAIIVPVLPFALKQQRSNFSDDEVQRWVSILLAAHGASWFIFSPICGYIGDHAINIRYGRQICILFGLATLATATACLCIGTSTSILLLGRIFQGAATAMNQTLPRAMLAERVGKKNAGVYMGYLTFVGCAANIAAFFLGGLIFERAGYRPVWYLCFGLIAAEATLWLGLIDNPARDEEEISTTAIDEEHDGAGYKHGPAIVYTEAPVVASHILPSSFDPEKKLSKVTTTELHVLDDIVTTIPSSPCDSISAQHHPSSRASGLPTLLRLLLSPRLAVTLFGTLIFQSIYAALDASLPVHLNQVFFWGAFPSGLMMISIYISGFLDPLVGWLCDRHGPKRVATAGLVLTAPVLISLRALCTDNDVRSKTILAVMLTIVGFTQSLTAVALNAEVAYAVEELESASTEASLSSSTKGGQGKKSLLAQAYSLNNMAIAAACTLGPMWAGPLSDAQGWHDMSLSLGIGAAVAAVPVWFVVGGSARKGNNSSR